MDRISQTWERPRAGAEQRVSATDTAPLLSAVAGIWRFDSKPQADDDCARMLAAQFIYGPHDICQWSGGALAIGRRLYRLLPEDKYDDQPLRSRDGRVTLVADIRLDNRDDLARELCLAGQETSRLRDAAILLAVLERWGEQGIDRLVGDFAFALWNAHAQRLLLARDFVGNRPLHYHCGSGFFAFASMPKGLHALAEIPYGPDEQMIAEYICSVPHEGPRSFFRDISRVEPAHVVTVTRQGVVSRRYWQPQRPRHRLKFEEYVEGLRHHLDLATRSHLRGANGAVASHLSAGLDSSSVTATAARLMRSQGGKVVAFTAVPRQGYEGRKTKWLIYDEGPLAGAIASQYANVEHVLVNVGYRSPLERFDRAFYACERPLWSPSNFVWVSAVNDAARERKLRILLHAGAGNTTATYHGSELLPELLVRGRFLKLLRAARGLIKHTWIGRRDAVAFTVGPFMPYWLWRWSRARFLNWPREDILDCSAIRPERLKELKLAALSRKRGRDYSGRPDRESFRGRAMMLGGFGDEGDSYKGYLGGWGVDFRDPLGDKRLAEFCLAIPTDQYLHDGVPRALAKAAFADRLPQAVLTERKMGYQAADWHEGLTAARDEVVAELQRLATCAPAARALDLEKLKRFADNWPTSDWEDHQILYSYREALLNGLTAGHFLRKASGTN